MAPTPRRSPRFSAGRPATALAVLLATLVAAGCVASQRLPGDPFGGGPSAFEEEVLLTVENHDYRDATIYAYWNGVRDRIGMVIGKTTKTFQVTWKSEEIQLEVDFVGGDAGNHRSEHIAVYGGDHLNYVIRPSGR